MKLAIALISMFGFAVGGTALGAPPVQRAQTVQRAPVAARAPARAPVPPAKTPASVPVMSGGLMRGPSSSHEIGEAMRVTGQSRNLSMGLLFSKDNDKIEFGNPRLHYKDKISPKQANY